MFDRHEELKDETDPTGDIKEMSIIKYGPPKCVAKPSHSKRQSVFTHPRDIETSNDVIQRITRHGLPAELGAKSAQRRHSEVVVTEEQLIRHLSEIAPPKQWSEGSLIFQQTLSTEPSSREETMELNELIDTLLCFRRAKRQGICSNRREVYSLLFDELLRQVSTENLLWGRLLLRIRNEINMTLEAYGALFNNSCSFGKKHHHLMTTGLDEFVGHRERLKQELEELKEQVSVEELSLHQQKTGYERMDQNRKIIDKLTKDKMVKLRRNYITAFNSLDPVTVGTFLKEGQTFEDVLGKKSEDASSKGAAENNESEAEMPSGAKSESHVHSLQTEALENISRM